MQGFTIQVNQIETTRCCFCVSRVSLFPICAHCQQHTVFLQHKPCCLSQFFLLGDIEHLFKILTLDKLNSRSAYFYSYIFKLCLFPSLLLIHTGLHKAWEPPCLCSAGQTTAGTHLNGKSMHSYFTFPQIYHSYHLINNLYSFKLQVFLWQDIK